MRRNFAIATIATIATGAALLLMAVASQDGIAATMNPAQIGKVEPTGIVEPAHCRSFRHCHRRWRRGRYVRYCHRC